MYKDVRNVGLVWNIDRPALRFKNRKALRQTQWESNGIERIGMVGNEQQLLSERFV
jgi:hypothetical protein